MVSDRTSRMPVFGPVSRPSPPKGPFSLLRRFLARLKEHEQMQIVLGSKKKKDERMSKHAEVDIRRLFHEGKSDYQRKAKRDEGKRLKKVVDAHRKLIDRHSGPLAESIRRTVESVRGGAT